MEEENFESDLTPEEDEMVMAFLRALYERETIEFIEPSKMELLDKIVDAIVSPIKANEDPKATYEIIQNSLFRNEITVQIIADGASWTPNEFAKLLSYSDYLQDVSILPRLDGKLLILFGIKDIKKVVEVN